MYYISSHNHYGGQLVNLVRKINKEKEELCISVMFPLWNVDGHDDTWDSLTPHQVGPVFLSW